MSKLVLTRKPGQAIRFELKPGLFVTATFETVSFNNGCRVRFDLGDFSQSEVVRVGHATEALDGVRLAVASVNYGQAKVLIDAPAAIKILRAELINSAA